MPLHDERPGAIDRSGRMLTIGPMRSIHQHVVSRAGYLVLFASGLMAALALGGDKAATDQDLIQGTWLFTRIIEDGKDMGGTSGVDQPHAGFEFVNNQLYTILDSKRDPHAGTFKLNSSEKPKQIEMVPPPGDKDAGQTIHGIYKIDGDVLSICQSDGEDIPTEFKSDRHHIVYELKRLASPATRPTNSAR